MLTAIRLRVATGVAISDEKVVATTVASTPVGVREVSSCEVPVGACGEGLTAALKKLREDGALKGFVTVGVSSRQSFYQTKRRVEQAPAQGGAPDLDLDGSMPQHLASAGRRFGGFAVDKVATKIRNTSYVITASCHKTIALQTNEGLQGLKATRTALEPVPIALQRLAREGCKAPRKWRAVVHVLLHEGEALAVLAYEKRAFMWRTFQMDGADSLPAVLLGFSSHIRQELGLKSLDGVVIHADSVDDALLETCKDRCDVEAVRAPAVPLDARTAAHALGLGGLRQPMDSPNLLRELRPPPTLKEMFPWATAGVLTAIVLVASFLLFEKAGSLEAFAEKLEVKTKKVMHTFRIKPLELRIKRNEHFADFAYAEAFVMSRVYWATVLRDLRKRMPETTALAALQGRDGLKFPDVSTKKKKSLIKRVGDGEKKITLHFDAQMKKGDASPADVKNVLNALAASEVFKVVFPKMHGAKVTRKTGKKADSAFFIVNCWRRN